MTQYYSSSFPPPYQKLSWNSLSTKQFDLMINMYSHFKVLTNWLYIIWKAKALDILISWLILFWTNEGFCETSSNRNNSWISPVPLEVWEHQGGTQLRDLTGHGSRCRWVQPAGGLSMAPGRSTGTLLPYHQSRKGGDSDAIYVKTLPFGNLFQWAQTTGTKNVC